MQNLALNTIGITQNLSIYNEEMKAFKKTEFLDIWIKEENIKVNITE